MRLAVVVMTIAGVRSGDLLMRDSRWSVYQTTGREARRGGPAGIDAIRAQEDG